MPTTEFLSLEDSHLVIRTKTSSKLNTAVIDFFYVLIFHVMVYVTNFPRKLTPFLIDLLCASHTSGVVVMFYVIKVIFYVLDFWLMSY